MIKSPDKKTRTCKTCGWVAFPVTREYAEDEVKRFNEYYDMLSAEEKEDYYGSKSSTIDNYERCFFCRGSYKNFRESEPGDCPLGCTLQPIITEEE